MHVQIGAKNSQKTGANGPKEKNSKKFMGDDSASSHFSDVSDVGSRDVLVALLWESAVTTSRAMASIEDTSYAQ